ncbi:MAG: DUF896 domain-containing protein [Firmicutes bacterium]|nr:DUF896 domain-containing protein [Bacillota bacterium]
MEMSEVIARINALARKNKAEGLTQHEREERDELRAIYLAAVRRNLRSELDHTYILRPDGTKEKLRPKGE